MNLMENLILPILVNIISPILLFLVAYVFIKNRYVAKKTTQIYQSVKNTLDMEIETEEVVTAKEVSDRTQDSKQDSILIDYQESAHEGTNILKKLSKNYGADRETGWEVRTFYTFTKEQLLKNKSGMINFQVRDSEFNIYIKTLDLINHFCLDSENEQISDGAGRIRAYIFQKTNSQGKKENYIVRFGKKVLDNPVKLVAET